MLSTPILFIVFNRPDTTAQVFEAIRNVRPSRLFIAADGPRDSFEEDIKACKEVRQIVSKIDWDCDVKTLFSDKNLGCRFGPIAAIKWFFNNVEQGIILEDDCLPDASFFVFCEELLDYYRDEEKIFSINGSNLGYTGCSFSYSYSRFMNMWGWATWKRVSDLIDYDMLYWEKMLLRKLWLYLKLNKGDYFNFDWLWLRYWDRRISWLLNGFSTWDYQWVFHQLKFDMLSVVPSQNLVTNIGCGVGATHTLDPNSPTSRIPLGSINFPLHHPNIIKNDSRYIEEIVKKVWCSGYEKVSASKALVKYFNKLV